jgi:hypothetical protein
MRRLPLAAVLALAMALPACASSRAYVSPDTVLPDAFMTVPDEKADEGSTSAVDVGHTILMYIPNRFLDLFDMVRVGVNVGPGIGGQVKATDPVQATFIERMSVGAGLESLRHLPVYGSAESAVGLGPLSSDMNLGLGWYQSPTDVRVEVHALLIGAHVAIDPVEIADFILGFFTIDLRKDDY